jgi:hypothetical protein
MKRIQKVLIHSAVILIIIFIYLHTYVPAFQDNYYTHSNEPQRLVIAHRPFSELLIQDVLLNTIDTSHPPIIYLILQPTIALTQSIDEQIVGLPFFIIGFFVLVSIYLVSAKLFSIPVGVVATLLLSQNATFIKYAIGIEDMGIFILLAIWTTYFFHETVIQKSGKTRALVVCNIVMLWSYYASFFVILAEFTYLIIFEREILLKIVSWRHIKKHIVLYVVCLIAITPLIVQVLTSVFSATLSPVSSDFLTNEGRINNIITNYFSFKSDFHFIETQLILNVFNVLILSGFLYTLYKAMKNKTYRWILFLQIPFLFMLPILNNYFKIYLRYLIAFQWIVFIIIALNIQLGSEIFSKLPMKKITKDITSIIVLCILVFLAINMVWSETRFSTESNILEIRNKLNEYNESVIITYPDHYKDTIIYHMFNDTESYFTYHKSCEYFDRTHSCDEYGVLIIGFEYNNRKEMETITKSLEQGYSLVTKNIYITPEFAEILGCSPIIKNDLYYSLYKCGINKTNINKT